MAELKPAYLIHGDDHGALAERRAGLRALAEREQGAAGVEVLEGDQATPAGAAAALAAMTLAVGRRVIIVEGAERWREAQVEQVLAPALAQIAPDTTLAIFAREEQRAKAPAALHAAVKAAGGQIVVQATVKPWELGKWTREQAARLGLSLDSAASKALVGQVGERQQRILRELEKLALEGEEGPGSGPRTVGAEEIEQRAAHSAELRAFGLADALVGADGSQAARAYLRLREQGERLAGLTYLMAGRLRDALAISQRLQAGESVAEVKRGLRMPSRAADRLLADVQRSDPERLRAALTALADLEVDTRGGAPLLADRTATAAMSEDTIAQRTIEEISV
ncbi:MAG TPA: DNA polymerase III subunit delta [Solirubrobacteraceae bacterium]